MTSELKPLWARFRSSNPRVRIRDAARQLGTTEADLRAAGLGENTIRLSMSDRELGWGAMIEKLPTLGRVMALTRNEYCVHERRGKYCEVGIYGQMGSVVGPDIDLRIFLRAWKFGFAVMEHNEDDSIRRSLQFFDEAGDSIHKVHLEQESNLSAFDAIVEEFRDQDQESPIITTPAEPGMAEKPDDEIDIEGFRARLKSLQDIHEFFGLLREFGIGRVQALRLAGANFAKRVSSKVAYPLLQKAARNALPIMVFVGNHGMIQIHTGEVRKIVPGGKNEEWINVLDNDFNLHLWQPGVHEAWITRKPTRDGYVTSVELFDSTGEMIVQFFGKRKPASPELKEWRSLVAELETGKTQT